MMYKKGDFIRIGQMSAVERVQTITKLEQDFGGDQLSKWVQYGNASYYLTVVWFYDGARFFECNDSYIESLSDVREIEIGSPQKISETEKDPHGKDPHETGAKLDAGKPRVELVLGGFSRALMEVVKVGTYGATKYTDNGWMDVPNGAARYRDAAGRHRLATDALDKDTGLLHRAHEAWNVLAALELELRDTEKELEK